MHIITIILISFILGLAPEKPRKKRRWKPLFLLFQCSVCDCLLFYGVIFSKFEAFYCFIYKYYQNCFSLKFGYILGDLGLYKDNK